MLFSLVGEIGFVVVGMLWVMDKWFDSFIDLMELMKNKDDEDKENEKMTEAAKRMYS